MDEKKLILSLIQDDLRSLRLINSLTAIGLDASDHHLDLGMTVFKLLNIQIKVTDTSFDTYLSLAGLAQYVPMDDSDNQLDSIALEIYNYLDTLPKNNSSKI